LNSLESHLVHEVAGDEAGVRIADDIPLQLLRGGFHLVLGIESGACMIQVNTLVLYLVGWAGS